MAAAHPTVIGRLRRYLYLLLETGPAAGLAGRVVDGFLVAVIVISTAALILETEETIPGRLKQVLRWIEFGSVILFSLEYVLRVWCAPEDRAHRYGHPVMGRLRYMLTPMALIDILAILPWYLSAFLPVDLLFLRVIRLFRLLKIVRYSQALITLGAVFRAEKRSLGAAFMVALVALILFSSVMWLVEGPTQPRNFGSIPRALYWGAITLTTVGYGDVVPMTPLGKFLGAMLAVLGIAMFTLPAAILAGGFMREIRKRDFMVTFTMLSAVPIFSRLDAHRLTEVAELLQSEIVPKHYAIIRRGDEAEALYIIAEGQVDVRLADGLHTLQKGDFFGEMGLLEDGAKRSATVTSATECRLLRLDKADFRLLIDAWPDLREEFMRIAHERAPDRFPEATDL